MFEVSAVLMNTKFVSTRIRKNKEQTLFRFLKKFSNLFDVFKGNL